MSTALGASRRNSFSLRASGLTISLGTSDPTHRASRQANRSTNNEHDATTLESARPSENANCPQFTILHKNGAHVASGRPDAFSEGRSVLVGGPDRPALGIFATCACHR